MVRGKAMSPELQQDMEDAKKLVMDDKYFEEVISGAHADILLNENGESRIVEIAKNFNAWMDCI